MPDNSEPPRPATVPSPQLDFAQFADGQLADSIVGGSHDALAEAYSRYGRQVHALAERLRGRSDADDVVQDVFLRLWDRPDCFDPTRGSLRSFLMMQAHGRAIDLLRSDASRRARDHTTLAERRPGSPAVDETALARLAGDHACKLMSRLTAIERQAIVLAYFGGHTYGDVAKLLALPEGTVKSRIRSGLRRLHYEMAAHDLEAQVLASLS
jgi:RNA polymerase sigma-70 factor (ECF subfamily)